MLWIGLFTFFTCMAQDTLPRQNILSSVSEDDFSERVFSAPTQSLPLDPLQKSVTPFENIFSRSSAIQSRQSGSPGVSLRGSSQAGRTLFLFDNIPLNLLDGYGGSSLFVPLELVQKLNVLEGPQSAMYGSNAMGGTLHFISEPSKTRKLNLGATESDAQGLFPTTTSHMSLIAPVLQSDRHSVQVSARQDTDRGDFVFDDIQNNRKQRQNNKSRLQRGTLYGQHQLQNFKLTEFVLYAQSDKITPGPISLPLSTQEKSNALLAASHLSTNISNSTKWNSRLSYARLSSHFTDSSVSTSLSDKLWTSHSLSSFLTDSFFSQTFVEASVNSYKASFAQNNIYRRNEADLGQIISMRILPNLLLEPSYRYALRYKKGISSLLLKQELDSTAHLWARWTEGYRPPSLVDLYAETSYFKGNSNLKAEASQQWEVGTAWKASPVSVQSSLFYTTYRDLIQSQSLSPGVSQKINTGKAETTGFHTVVQSWLKPNFHFVFDASFLWTREETTGRQILFSPQQQFFTMLSYSQNKWTWHLQHSYWSAFEDTDFMTGNRVELSAWNGTDLLCDYKINQKLTTSFGIYNLADHRRELNFNYPEPQRRFAASLSLEF